MLFLLYPFEIALSFLASFLRLGAGEPLATGGGRKNTRSSCTSLRVVPFCRIAREAVSETGVADIGPSLVLRQASAFDLL